MNWGSIDNFLAMGGYAFYVWGSYGVTALVIAAEMWLLGSRARKAHEDLLHAVAARGAR